MALERMSRMQTVAMKKPRPRRFVPPEFKAEIVARCQAGDRTIGQVARDFDLVESSVALANPPDSSRIHPRAGATI
jgi:transposase